MAFPIIQYDAAAGSDTAASGAGPVTAITGASATAGAGNVINLDGSPDLSGVASDGSAAIWVNGATGTHLAKITAVDNTAKTVTTEILMATAGVSWAIGGERRTLINDTGRYDWEDWRSGWRVEFDSGLYVVGDGELFFGAVNNIGDNLNGPLIVTATPALSGALPIIRRAAGAANGRLFHLNTAVQAELEIFNIHLQNNVNWGGGAAVRATNTNHRIVVRLCEISSTNPNAIVGQAAALEHTASGGLSAYDNYIHGGFRYAYLPASGTRTAGIFQGNYCEGPTVRLEGGASFTSHIAIDNIIINAKEEAIYVETSTNANTMVISGNTIFGGAGDGIFIDGDASEASFVTITNNIIAECAGYGINAAAGAPSLSRIIDFNAFHANTMGDFNLFDTPIGDGNILAAALTVDPFTDSAGGDFSINDLTNGGALVRAKALHKFSLSPNTTGLATIGAVQLAAGGGGGDSFFLPRTLQNLEAGVAA